MRASVAIFVPHAGCPHKCSFCDQHTISGSKAPPTPAEVRLLLARAKETLGEKASQAEVAFFGGSFTSIDPGLRNRLLEAAAPFVGGSGFAGIRISTRPDAIDGEILRELKAFRVTAIEIGAQSMDDNILALAGRGHTAEDVVCASGLIRKAGFSLGLQMMTGLPGDDGLSSLETARKLAALRPDTMRVYPALVIAGTRLETLYRTGEYIPPPLEDTVGLCSKLLLYFHSRGISVIRLGLHQTETLSARLVAGPHHPALRELAEGKILLDAAIAGIRGQNLAPCPIELLVRREDISKMAGQDRRNLKELEALGYPARIRASEAVGVYEVIVSPVCS